MNVYQMKPLNERQVQNNAGGYVYQIDPIHRLNRFLFLGCEKGTFYQNKNDINIDNISSLDQLIRLDHRELECLDLIKEIHRTNRCAKDDYMLFVLAYLFKSKHVGDDIKNIITEFLPSILTIPTKLFMFVENCQIVSLSNNTSKGWGRRQRRLISDWYSKKDTEKLTYLLTKYQRRNNWTHRDIFRLIHPVVSDTDYERVALYKWVVKNEVPDFNDLAVGVYL